MKINYKSDFEFDYTLLDEHGQATTPPDFPWKLVLSIGNPLKPYAGQCDCINGRNFVASFDGTQYKNCTVADTVIRVFADNHGLPCGQLWATFITYTPNPDFPDGDKRIYAPVPTDIELVSGKGDDATEAVIEVIASYILRDAYDIAVAAGYNGTREAYYDALRNLPNDTNAARHQINELIEGKAMIASALTDRGYPTQATDSSASMAQKITEMAYDAGWLAQIGYTEENSDEYKALIAKSKECKEAYESGAVSNFQNDTTLMIAPVLDVSQKSSLQNLFNQCTSLCIVPDSYNTSTMLITTRNMFYGTKIVSAPAMEMKNVTDVGSMFRGCANLKYIPAYNTENCTLWSDFVTATALERIEMLDLSASGSIFAYESLPNLVYMFLRNIGKKSTVTSYSKLNCAKNWGNGSEENRQSLVDSLLTYSYDRATAGYSACTITIHANTLARLTAEEIAAITAKGFTLTS